MQCFSYLLVLIDIGWGGGGGGVDGGGGFAEWVGDYSLEISVSLFRKFATF